MENSLAELCQTVAISEDIFIPVDTEFQRKAFPQVLQQANNGFTGDLEGAIIKKHFVIITKK